MSQADGFEAGRFVGGLGDDGNEERVFGARGEEQRPKFPLDEGVEQASAAVASRATAFVEGVVGWMLGMSDEVAGEGDGLLSLP